MSDRLPISPHPDGLRLAVRLTPRAGRDAARGVTEEADGRPVLRLRIAAPPVDGAANKALIGFLAKRLGIPARDISLLSGETGRAKLVLLKGDGAALARRVEDWLRET